MRFRPLNNEAVVRACSKVARASEGSVARLFGSPEVVLIYCQENQIFLCSRVG